MDERIACAECGARLFSAAVLARSMPGITHDAGCPIAWHDEVIGAPRSKADALRRTHDGRPAYVQLVALPESTYRAKPIAYARDRGSEGYVEWWCEACGQGTVGDWLAAALIEAADHNLARHPRRWRAMGFGV